MHHGVPGHWSQFCEQPCTVQRPHPPPASFGACPGCISSRTARSRLAWPLRWHGQPAELIWSTGVNLGAHSQAHDVDVQAGARLLPPRPLTSLVSSTMHTNFVAAISTICNVRSASQLMDAPWTDAPKATRNMCRCVSAGDMPPSTALRSL